METLEFILPYVDSVEVTIDNRLVGWVENWDEFDGYDRGRYSIPLPEGNWRILSEDRDNIKIGNFK